MLTSFFDSGWSLLVWMKKSLLFNNSTENSLIIKHLRIMTTRTECTWLDITSEGSPQTDFHGINLGDDKLLSPLLIQSLLLKLDWIGVIFYLEKSEIVYFFSPIV